MRLEAIGVLRNPSRPLRHGISCYSFPVGDSARHRTLVWLVAIGTLVGLAVAPTTTALIPGTELLVPAAARTGPWATDLYLLNLSNHDNEVTIEWLERGQPNPDPTQLNLSLAGNESRILEDVIRTGFGLDRGRGAFRITSSAEVVAPCRIFATEGGGTYGQGFEAVPTEVATAAGTATHVLGLTSTEDFRANLYAIAGADGATVRLTLIDTTGSQLADAELVLGTYEPYLEPLTAVFSIAAVEQATLLVDVSAGSVVVGASKIDNTTSDPTTLSSWVPGAGDPLAAGSYFGVVVDGDSAATGGLTLLFDGEGNVVGIEFSYPPGACSALLTAGQDLSGAPLSLTELGAGYTFTTSYPGGGTMEWSLQLAPQAAGQSLAGSLAATGSDWSGELEPCNGAHEALSVALGSKQLSTRE